LSLQVFKWDVPQSENYERFRIQVSSDAKFTEPFVDETVTSTRYRLTESLEPGLKYYWRVGGLPLLADSYFGDQPPSDWLVATSFFVSDEPVRSFPYRIRLLSYEELPYTEYSQIQPTPEFTDTDGIIMFSYEGELYYHPVQLIQYALERLDRFVQGEDEAGLVDAQRHFDKLLSLSVLNDDALFFPYPFTFYLHGLPGYPMNAPWYSGMAQGLALSLASRLAWATGDAQYVHIAEQVLNSVVPFDREFPSELSVTHIDELGHYWILEYPNPSNPNYALNGFLFAIFGLYDFVLLAESSQTRGVSEENSVIARRLLLQALATAEFYSDDYRVPGELSLYCREHKYQSSIYHRIHIRQFLQFFRVTEENLFLDFAIELIEDAR
jgi:hypothetical protein